MHAMGPTCRCYRYSRCGRYLHGYFRCITVFKFLGGYRSWQILQKSRINAKKPVGITETILRDAHQSLIATRMTTEQMLPIVEKMDQVGYHSVECWGGATFDASLRFLKEDPWERLRKFRAGFKNTKLQMLFRGQNILGYRPYADDVVEYFVQKSIANGYRYHPYF